MNIDKGIALNNVATGVETVVFPQGDYTEISKLSRIGKRKLLRRMEKRIALKDMSYEQARLFHRLKGRIR